ncbi:hypothetical protein Y1Q_0007478 [Alligator mississippiensis]|uniref:Uncharacterized protein n=1 Tax=Alligator mississippiensis TaxID=8496 RepID=A0A151M4V3_ALLMI|nr:hypothetical protein Y1Q_0007478 [Alligator mississippiensis]
MQELAHARLDNHLDGIEAMWITGLLLQPQGCSSLTEQLLQNHGSQGTPLLHQLLLVLIRQGFIFFPHCCYDSMIIEAAKSDILNSPTLV